MLVLSRLAGERIILGEGAEMIVLTVVRTGHSVRIGIDAPAWVNVVREEIQGTGDRGQGTGDRTCRWIER